MACYYIFKRQASWVQLQKGKRYGNYPAKIMPRHTALELSSISDSVASRSEFPFTNLLLLGSEPRFCAVSPGGIFEARRCDELKTSPGSLKLYDCRESDFRVETH